MQAGKKRRKKIVSIVGYATLIASVVVGLYVFMPHSIYSHMALDTHTLMHPIHLDQHFVDCDVTNTCVYGSIVSSSSELINGSSIDKVVLYSQRAHNSHEKIERHGILVRNDNAKATIVLAHGFRGDKYYGGFLRYMFQRDQYNFMSFDFRAHGDNIANQYCTFGHDEAYDVIAAAKFIKSQPDLAGKPIIVYGFSMGAVASIVAQAAQPNLFDAMILDCPFDTSANVIRHGLGEIKFSLFGYQFAMPCKQWLEKYVFHPYVQSVVKGLFKAAAHVDSKNIRTHLMPISTVDAIQKVTVPCFFIHCRNDERVPVMAARNLYEKAAGHKKLWITNGRGHFDSFLYKPEQYASHIQQFLTSFLNNEFVQAEMSDMVIEDTDDVQISQR